MSKIIRKSNFRLIVEPKRLGDYGSIRVSDNYPNKTPEQVERDYQKRCEQIAEQIKRHVDEVDQVEIDFDADEYCSHCKDEWAIDAKGSPLCCDEAVQEWEKSKEVKA